MLPTLICIDDEAHNNEALERLLRKKYKVITTTQPAEGLELIKQHQPTIIISDQRMPQITGVELLKKSIEHSPDSIRILLTGYTDLESVISAINEGQIYRYLTKPWDPNDLTLTIDKAYETYQLRQELKAQNEQLKSLDRLKTEFMILVTHELRTPLTGMTSFLDLLKEDIKNTDQQLYLSHIEKNANRLKKLIEDILVITRLKSESSKDSPVSEIQMKSSIESEWKRAADKNKKLKLVLSVDVDSWASQESLWRDILHRLFLNCAQHAVADSEVLVKVSQLDEQIQLTISNKTEQPINFEPQNLIAAFTKNEKIMNHTQGTGLGLSIVHSLAQALQGNLQISAKGTTFTVTIRLPENPTTIG